MTRFSGTDQEAQASHHLEHMPDAELLTELHRREQARSHFEQALCTHCGLVIRRVLPGTWRHLDSGLDLCPSFHAWPEKGTELR